MTGWIDLLRCPCCGGAMSFESLRSGGALLCRRRRWPVAEGIPVLVETPETDRALELLAAGDEATAVAVLAARQLRSTLDLARMRAGEWLLRRPRGQGPAAARVARRLRAAAPRGFAAGVAALFGRPPWAVPATADYFRFRRSDPSFVAAEAAALALLPAAGPVLDLGCGTGHLAASLVARGHAPVVAVDVLFAALLLGKRHVAPTAHFVCAEAGAPLPIATAAVAAVVCVDAFFDFPSLPGAATELGRVLRPGGTALVSHLHNRLLPHRYAGRCPLTPAEYLEVLAPLGAGLMDERVALRAAVEPGRFAWRFTGATPELDDAPDLVAVAGAPATGVEGDGPLLPAPVGRHALNPLYRVEPAGSRVRLARGSWRYTSEEEWGSLGALLPVEVEVEAEVFAALPAERPPAGLDRELLRARVVLPLPEGMIDAGPAHG